MTKEHTTTYHRRSKCFYLSNYKLLSLWMTEHNLNSSSVLPLLVRNVEKQTSKYKNLFCFCNCIVIQCFQVLHCNTYYFFIKENIVGVTCSYTKRRLETIRCDRSITYLLFSVLSGSFISYLLCLFMSLISRVYSAKGLYYCKKSFCFQINSCPLSRTV